MKITEARNSMLTDLQKAQEDWQTKLQKATNIGDQRRNELQASLLKMDSQYKNKIRSLEQTLIDEAIMPEPSEEDGFYEEASPLESGVEPVFEAEEDAGANDGPAEAAARQGSAMESALSRGTHGQKSQISQNSRNIQKNSGGALVEDDGPTSRLSAAAGAPSKAPQPRRAHPVGKLNTRAEDGSLRGDPTSKMSGSKQSSASPTRLGKGGAGAGKLNNLMELLNLMQNEMKNQDLKFAQQIEKINGDMQTSQEKQQRMLEDIGVDVTAYEEPSPVAQA